MHSYFRIKRFVVLSLGAIILIGIAAKELAWASGYVETPATIVRFEQSCAGGSRGRGYIDCEDAFAGADRRTTLTVRYASPADRQMHEALIRCDTSAEDTPSYWGGQEIVLLAHQSEPERVDRRKCVTLGGEG